MLDVLSSRPPRPSGRKPRWARDLSTLVTKRGEKSGAEGEGALNQRDGEWRAPPDRWSDSVWNLSAPTWTGSAGALDAFEAPPQGRGPDAQDLRGLRSVAPGVAEDRLDMIGRDLTECAKNTVRTVIRRQLEAPH